MTNIMAELRTLLSYLHRLPIDALKIDRSFVTQLGDIAKKAEIVRTIIALGRNLNIAIIAEGIETKSQLAKLRELGCAFGQGYLFSRPVEAREAREFIRKSKPPIRLAPAASVAPNETCA